MRKRFMLLIAAMMMTSLMSQASEAPANTGFTVTQIALDTVASKAEAEEDTNGSVEETQAEGGETEKK